MEFLYCPNCGRMYNDGRTYYCVSCNYKLKPKDSITEIKHPELSDVSSRVIGTVSSQSTNVPKCPTCQSTNIRKIGSVERGASVFMLGIFSKKINKTFKCNNCGYTW